MMHRFLPLVLLLACNSDPAKINLSEAADTIIKIKKDTSLPVKAVPEDSLLFDTSLPEINYRSQSIHLLNGDSFVLRLPVGYNITIAAQGLGRLRFLALSPDNRLFATDMYDRSDNRKGRVLIFDKWDNQTRTFQSVVTYTDSLHNPNQAAFYKNYIYIAETGRLIRFPYRSGDNSTNDKAEVIAVFPDHGLSYKYGGWHLTRSIAFNNDKLYISVGSSCNACVEKEEIRAAIIEMDPDGNNKKIFARGLRNSVGIKWIGNQLWATGMGRDLIGPDKPEDLFQKIDRDNFYGWPYYFQFRNTIQADPQFEDSIRSTFVKIPPVAFAGFKAHSAPLGFEFFKNFNDSILNNRVLVCLHGSTSVWRQRGNSIAMIGKGNNYTDFISGFLSGKTEKERHGRPCDILMYDNRSFFFTDDHNGVLYYVWK